VKVQVVGAAGSVSTALSSGAATPHLQTWGRLGDQVLRVVACRQTLCSSSGTDVPIHVAYSAPTLTAPTGGEAFTSDWTASASSTAPAVRFVDEAGHTLATDTSEPFSATIPLGRLTSGAHTVYAVACDATGKVCDPAPATGGADITVSRLDPRLTNITPLPFSPNGDGRRDSTKATYVLDVASTTTVTVTAASGATVRSVSLGSLTAGTHSWTWNGRNDAGQVVAGGRYVVHVNTSTTAPALTGTSSRGVTVDLVHPSVTSVATTYPTVFPIVDGYRDSTHLSARISEPATVVIRVLKSSGATAWSWRAWRSRAGAVSAVWDGGSSDGHALPAGTYRVQVQATDLAGNRTTAAAKSVSISQRKAVKRTWTHTSTAASVSGGGYQATDSASTVSFYDPFGSGALRFHASATGRVRTVNRLALRSAVAYVSVRVDAFARGVGGGQAYLAFIDDAGHEVHGATLSSSTGTHHGHVASATASLLDGHKARWELVVSGGDTYDVRSFTVTLTYLVLV
jgi:flagellar hook assembly protein FlgD